MIPHLSFVPAAVSLVIAPSSQAGIQTWIAAATTTSEES